MPNFFGRLGSGLQCRCPVSDMCGMFSWSHRQQESAACYLPVGCLGSGLCVFVLLLYSAMAWHLMFLVAASQVLQQCQLYGIQVANVIRLC